MIVGLVEEMLSGVWGTDLVAEQIPGTKTSHFCEWELGSDDTDQYALRQHAVSDNQSSASRLT